MNSRDRMTEAQQIAQTFGIVVGAASCCEQRDTRDTLARAIRCCHCLFRSAMADKQLPSNSSDAIARDPQYGPALGFAAQCCMHLATDASARIGM
jgi:hypothetical protein